VFALFVPPFEVTILNHSPRLILAVPSKVSVQKMGKSVLSVFIFDPTWYITDVTTEQWGHDANYVHAIVEMYSSKAIFWAVATPQVKAQNLPPLLIFS
jgi:hypothetical protein